MVSLCSVIGVVRLGKVIGEGSLCRVIGVVSLCRVIGLGRVTRVVSLCRVLAVMSLCRVLRVVSLCKAISTPGAVGPPWVMSNIPSIVACIHRSMHSQHALWSLRPGDRVRANREGLLHIDSGSR